LEQPVLQVGGPAEAQEACGAIWIGHRDRSIAFNSQSFLLRTIKSRSELETLETLRFLRNFDKPCAFPISAKEGQCHFFREL